MKGKGKSCGGTTKDLYSAVNKNMSDKERKPRISFRVGKDLLQELEQESENRSEAIREALRSEYGGSSE